MGELEGRLLKRIQAIESQLTQYGTQEIPLRQRELKTKMNRILQTTDLPSFGHDSSSKSLPLASSELRLKEVEVNHQDIVTENKKLQARILALEESRTSIKVNQVIDRLDDVIKVVNTQSADTYHLPPPDQSIQDIQQELLTLRQTVDSWNDEQQNDEEDQICSREVITQDEVPDLPLHDGQELPYDPPPGLTRSPSMAGSGTSYHHWSYLW